MAYTPQLSKEASSTLRRIAWAMHAPMTSTLESIMTVMPRYMKREQVCKACRDRSNCMECAFNEERILINDRKGEEAHHVTSNHTGKSNGESRQNVPRVP